MERQRQNPNQSQNRNTNRSENTGRTGQASGGKFKEGSERAKEAGRKGGRSSH